MSITWAERVQNIRKAMGREPTLAELLDVATIHRMTPEEVAEQRASWVRGMTARCEHGMLDFEQCGQCCARRR